jgi:hypothetical protein
VLSEMFECGMSWKRCAGLFTLSCRYHGSVRFKVQYDDYGNQETVDAFAVRPRAASGPSAKAGGGAVKKRKVGEKAVEHDDDAEGDEGLKIPESLKILPGDSDKVRLPAPSAPNAF